MKKKICYSLLLLVSVLILFAGCGESKKEAKTVHKQPVRQEKPEEESEVKAALAKKNQKQKKTAKNRQKRNFRQNRSRPQKQRIQKHPQRSMPL